MSEDAPDTAQDSPSCPCGLQAHAGILVGVTEPQSHLTQASISLCPALPISRRQLPHKRAHSSAPLTGGIESGGDHGCC